MKAWILPFVMLLGACSSEPLEEAGSHSDGAGEPREAVGTTSEALSSSVASTLAHPEYDVTANAGYWWMHATDAAGIQARIDAGFRLVSIDVVSWTPLLFAGAFVQNTGIYARTGGGFDPDYTLAELNAAIADPNRRVVDIAPHYVGITIRYATVWVGNTGTQKKTYKVALTKTWAQLTAEATTGGSWRLTDLESLRPRTNCPTPPNCPLTDERFYGVFIQNTGNDARTQSFRTETYENIKARIGGGRLADIEPSKQNHGTFYFVTENKNSDEKGWWGTGLFDTDAQHPDSVYHAPLRTGGRYTKLKPYVWNGTQSYAGVLVSREDVPTRGSSNASNAALNAIDAAAKTRIKNSGTPGLVLAISKNGNLVHARGYGKSDVAAGRLTEPTDMFRLASVSKTIGAAAILRLIQDSARIPGGAERPLTLASKVFGGIFPYTAPAQTPNLGQITVQHLLEHRSGLNGSYFEWIDTPANVITREAEVRADGQAPFASTPGTTRGYLNVNFHLITQIVARVSGLTYENYVKTKFMDPIGVTRVKVSQGSGSTHTGGLIEAVNYQPLGPGNREVGSDPLERGNWSHAGVHRNAASAYTASPVHFVRWLSSLSGARAGLARAIDATRFDWIQSRASNPGSGVGVGFDLISLPSGIALAHGGLLPWTNLADFRLRADGITFAWATNSADFDGAGLNNDINGILDTSALPDRDLSSTYF